MKFFKIYFIYLAFLSLVIYSGYLYSLRWDYLSWGASNRDGLFFIAYYVIIMPLMIITAIIKRLMLKTISNAFGKNNFFLYLLLISLPALDTHGSQISLGFGVVICIIICICILLEIAKYKIKISKQ